MTEQWCVSVVDAAYEKSRQDSLLTVPLDDRDLYQYTRVTISYSALIFIEITALMVQQRTRSSVLGSYWMEEIN